MLCGLSVNPRGPGGRADQLAAKMLLANGGVGLRLITLIPCEAGGDTRATSLS